MDRNSQEDTTRDWPDPGNYRKSVRRQFSLFVALLVLVLMSFTGFVITNRYVHTVTQSVLAKHLAQARAYSRSATKPILSPGGADKLLLNDLCKKLAEDNADVYWVGIADRDSVYLANTNIKAMILSERIPRLYGDSLEYEVRKGETLIRSGDTIYVGIPIMENEFTIGHFLMATSTGQITDAKNSAITLIAVITFVMIIVGVISSLILVRRGLRPLALITEGLQHVDASQLAIKIPITGENEFGYLAATLEVMGVRLSLAHKAAVERERINREYEIAREIQSKILPSQYPSAEGYQFVGTYRSAKEVGGDYYDFYPLDNGSLGFLIADVSGKSLPGMLVMLLTRDIVRSVAHGSPSPREALCKVNKELSAQIKRGMFVTMFYGVLNPGNGELAFASAGHNPLLRVNSNTSSHELIKTKGYPLGMMSPDKFDERLEEKTIQLSPGDWIIQYTDGINEAQNETKEEFGMDRLLDTSLKLRQRKPEEFVSDFIEELDKFVGKANQYDDITLLALKWESARSKQNEPEEFRKREYVN